MPTISSPNDPATTKQTFMIFKLSKEDVRKDNLTKQQASDMIQSLLAERGTKPSVEKKTGSSNFSKIMEEATKAANLAGDDWMAKAKPAFRVVQRQNQFDDNSPIIKDFGTMLDVCGIVYLRIIDRRTAFAKWIKTEQKSDSRVVRVAHKYRMRQEMGLLEACEAAAMKVLFDNNINGIEFYSRID